MDEYIAKPIHAQELFDLIEGRSSPCGGPSPHLLVTPETAAVNWSEALQLVRGDRKLLRELVKIALPEIPRLLGALREGVEAGDATSVRLTAHTLKGSVRCFGSTSAFEQLLQLERMGREHDLVGAQAVLTILDGEFARILQALSDHLQTPLP
jgi:HPt (histidine-containing phosphotransfer) domain-containing protein